MPVFACTLPRAGGRAHAVGERAAPAGDRQRGDQVAGARRDRPRRPAAGPRAPARSGGRARRARSRRRAARPPSGTPASARAPRTISAPRGARAGLAVRAAPSCLSSSSAVKLSLTRPIQATICESGADSTEASGTSSSRCVPWPAPVDRHSGAAQRVAEQERGGERRVARGAAEVAAAVDRQRRERRALVDVEPRLPARPGAARVEERLVAEDAARHLADAGRPHLPRQRRRGPRSRASGRRGRRAAGSRARSCRPARRGRARRSRCGSRNRARPARA